MPETKVSDTADSDAADKGIPEVVGELADLTKRYALQEVVGPLKSVGRFLVYGFAAAVLGGIGVILLLLSGLRLLQAHTGTALTGSWSWVPYVIVLLVAVLVAGLVASRIGKKKG